MRPPARLPTLLGSVAVLGVCALAWAARGRLLAQAPDLAAIDRYAARLLDADRVPGAALAIVRDGRPVHVRGFGRDRAGRPVTGRTSFVLGSMSKSITALAVMQLVEQGRVALDAPVRRYLPAFRLAAADSGASVTVRHLLLHTSGIPHRAGGASDARGAGASLASRVAALRDVAPTHAPGTRHAYASPNYLVLGAIVEAVAGVPFAAYVEREIFAPLAMHDSFTDRSRALARAFAGGHVYALGFPVPSTLAAEPDRLPTAGLMSSAEDLSHFLAMQLDGGRFGGRTLLADTSVRRMHAGGAPGDGFSYAFGWREGRVGGARAVHHGGIVPDFRGKMVMLPDAGWGVVVLTNASSAVPWPIAPTSHRLADDVAAYLAGRPLPAPTSRHRALFAGVAAAMGLVLLAQLRTLWRTWRVAPEPRAGPRRLTRADATDVAFLVGVGLLPRLVGLTWRDLWYGAPDVAGWLLALGALSAVTVGVRVRRGRAGVTQQPPAATLVQRTVHRPGAARSSSE
ncbi:serine hydrolase domain-containing protein [Roseisolibacter sp. H3M3-2]|uniref:serine hydrolase domain-containing protein n=1 Tax=Roseisolibacter sp. H3M3-2 TaxID=3031323 RepID=UPI0023DBC487|nr:serine hydrolase domain-containing protein [Roseisolibacter sp. H3M3-2]MDF1504156.1 serine hydrolase [Roseisolibacter sp. H3M3-2]